VRILLVDDEELDLFIGRKLLGVEFEVEGFTTQVETLNWAKQNDFDVALIDYYLGPNLFAGKLLAELRKVKNTPFTAFVLTSFVNEKQIQELRNDGFKEVISKPLSLESFKKKLNSA
jgi:CheY-like chemotaxis protein